MAAQHEDDLDYDFGPAMQEAFQSGDFGNSQDHVPHQMFDEDGLPILSSYVFGTYRLVQHSSDCFNSCYPCIDANNKYLESPSTRSSLADAKALLEQNGTLSEIALLLEAAIQKDELGEGGYETWILLGEVRNMDEREEAGMRALVEGVKRAEAAGAAGAGQLVS